MSKNEGLRLGDVVVAVGYNSDEKLPIVREEDVSPDITIRKVKEADHLNYRPVEQVSLGVHLHGALLPHVNTRDSPSLQAGVRARMGRKLPDVTADNFYSELSWFTREIIKRRQLTKISRDADQSFDAWISRTSYPFKRREELRNLWDDVTDLLERGSDKKLKRFKVKLFCKDETYPAFKMARGIYAREDVAKLFFGRYFKLMEDIVYELPEFIKHIPVRERGRYIMDRLYVEGRKYMATDYSSFECHHSKERMEAVEFIYCKHFLEEMPGGMAVFEIMKEVLSGINVVENRWFSCRIKGRQMSGETNTSLFNGLLNFTQVLYALYKCGQISLDDLSKPYPMVIEGDDCLAALDSTRNQPTGEQFASYGCLIKLEVYNQISQASFCGLLFDEIDQQVITDPFDVVCSLGWTTKQYTRASSKKKKSLLRCKALSCIVQYPSCPIISALARYTLRCTRGVDVRATIEKKGFCLWEREQLRDGLAHWRELENIEVGIQTRLLFSDLYGISVAEQRHIEQYLDSLTELQPLHIPAITDLCPKSWTEYWEEYVCVLGKTEESAKITWNCVPLVSVK